MTAPASPHGPSRPRKAVVVAAGRGRRLMPYTDEMPKCLVPVAGRSILARQLAAFAGSGVREFAIVRGYLGDVLERRMGEVLESAARLASAISGAGSSAVAPGDLTVRFVDNPGWEHNNVLLSLFHARHELHGPVLVSYSDIIFTPGVVAKLMDAEGALCLVIDRDFRDIYRGRTEHPLPEAEVADLDERGHVRRVGKRSLSPEDAWGEFIGLAKLSAAGTARLVEAWDHLRREYDGRGDQPFQRAARFENAYLTDIIQYLIDAGHPVTPVGIRGRWREIDTTQDLSRADVLVACNEEDWK